VGGGNGGNRRLGVSVADGGMLLEIRLSICHERAQWTSKEVLRMRPRLMNSQGAHRLELIRLKRTRGIRRKGIGESHEGLRTSFAHELLRVRLVFVPYWVVFQSGARLCWVEERNGEWRGRCRCWKLSVVFAMDLQRDLFRKHHVANTAWEHFDVVIPHQVRH